MALNKADPLVSIIIPAYNYGKFLPITLRNVLDSDYLSKEIIVVDDGSTDDTPHVVKPFLGKIEYIRQENKGLSGARNTGISNAHGDYVLFLDSDDLISKNSITSRVKFLEKNPEYDVAVCKNFLFSHLDNAGKIIKNGLWVTPKRDLDIHLLHFNIAPPHAFLLRKSVIDNVGKFDTSLKACEDYDYWLRCIKKGHKFGYSNGVVFYRRHSASMSANLTKQWHYDLMLHIKIPEYFPGLVMHNYRNTDSVNARLAYVSGCAITLSRAAERDEDLEKKVLRNTEEELGELANELPRAEMTALSWHYILKLFNIDASVFRDEKLAEQINHIKFLAKKRAFMNRPEISAVLSLPLDLIKFRSTSIVPLIRIELLKRIRTIYTRV